MSASPARLATYIAIPTAIVAAGITATIIANNLSGVGDASKNNSSALSDVTVPEVAGTQDICANLVDGLPTEIDGRTQRPVKSHPGSMAWGQPPVVLICGVAKPADYKATAQLTVVNDVTWFVQTQTDTSAYGVPGDNTLWTAMDREVYIAVAVPNDVAGSAALAPISTAVKQRLKSTEK